MTAESAWRRSSHAATPANNRAAARISVVSWVSAISRPGHATMQSGTVSGNFFAPAMPIASHPMANNPTKFTANRELGTHWGCPPDSKYAASGSRMRCIRHAGWTRLTPYSCIRSDSGARASR